MAKKNINDADFFDDDHLELVGDDVEAVDPFASSGETPDDVVDDDAAASDDENDEVGEVDDADDAGDEDPAEWVDPAPHLPDDPRALKQAYHEARNIGNAKAMEAQKALERVAQLENDLAEFDFNDQEPTYDGNAFAQIHSQNPVAAFQYAIDNGQHTDAQAAIASIRVDAQQFAAAAAMAQAADDGQAYAQYRSQAQSAEAHAMQLQSELQRSMVAKDQQPIIEHQQRQNLNVAQAALAQATEGDYTARLSQVQQVLAANPHLITGHDAESLQRGLGNAYLIAKNMPAPVAVSPVASVDDAAKAAVDKYLADTRAAKKRAADDAVGATSGRVAPGASGDGGTEKDEIYSRASSASKGARAFMDL